MKTLKSITLEEIGRLPAGGQLDALCAEGMGGVPEPLGFSYSPGWRWPDGTFTEDFNPSTDGNDMLTLLDDAERRNWLPVLCHNSRIKAWRSGMGVSGARKSANGDTPPLTVARAHAMACKVEMEENER